MLELERKGDEVFCQNHKLTIVAQATKGVGKEVVKIEGLEGSNGQKWISLSRLKEGLNQIETQAREVSSKNYTLTFEEQQQINDLQAQIDAIIERARARYVKVPNLKVDTSKMTQAEKDALANQLEAYLATIRG